MDQQLIDAPSGDSAGPISGSCVLQIVGFHLGREEYGLDIMKVQEIILFGAITSIPQVPEHVRGLINLRGHVIPILDLRKAFGHPEIEANEEQRIIVVNVADKTIGIVVDSVSQVTRVSEEQIEAPPSSLTGRSAEYLTGLIKVEDRMVILLDLEGMIQSLNPATSAALSD